MVRSCALMVKWSQTKNCYRDEWSSSTHLLQVNRSCTYITSNLQHLIHIPISSTFFLVIDLIILPPIHVHALFDEVGVAVDIDMEVLVQFQYAFVDALLLFYGHG